MPRISKEAKGQLMAAFDTVRPAKNVYYRMATMPPEVRAVIEEHKLVYDQVKLQLKNWKAKEYDFAGMIYSKNPAEIKELFAAHVPQDDQAFAVQTIKKMINDEGEDLTSINSYDWDGKRKLKLPPLVVQGGGHDDVIDFLARVTREYADIAAAVFPKKAEVLQDAEFDFTQQRLSKVKNEWKACFLELSSLEPYERLEKIHAWMKIECSLFYEWTLHHYDGHKPDIVIDLEEYSVHKYSLPTLYYIAGWILHQLYTALAKCKQHSKTTELAMQEFSVANCITKGMARELRLPTSVADRKEKKDLRRPGQNFFEFVKCLEYIYVQNVTVDMMIAYAAGDILQAIGDAIGRSDDVRDKFYHLFPPSMEEECNNELDAILAFVVKKFRRMRGRALQRAINGQTCKGANAVDQMTTRLNVAAKAQASCEAAAAVRKASEKTPNNADTDDTRDSANIADDAMGLMYKRAEEGLPSYAEVDIEVDKEHPAVDPSVEGCTE